MSKECYTLCAEAISITGGGKPSWHPPNSFLKHKDVALKSARSMLSQNTQIKALDVVTHRSNSSLILELVQSTNSCTLMFTTITQWGLSKSFFSGLETTSAGFVQILSLHIVLSQVQDRKRWHHIALQLLLDHERAQSNTQRLSPTAVQAITASADITYNPKALAVWDGWVGALKEPEDMDLFELAERINRVSQDARLIADSVNLVVLGNTLKHNLFWSAPFLTKADKGYLLQGQAIGPIDGPMLKLANALVPQAKAYQGAQDQPNSAATRQQAALEIAKSFFDYAHCVPFTPIIRLSFQNTQNLKTLLPMVGHMLDLGLPKPDPSHDNTHLKQALGTLDTWLRALDNQAINYTFADVKKGDDSMLEAALRLYNSAEPSSPGTIQAALYTILQTVPFWDGESISDLCGLDALKAVQLPFLHVWVWVVRDWIVTFEADRQLGLANRALLTLIFHEHQTGVSVFNKGILRKLLSNLLPQSLRQEGVSCAALLLELNTQLMDKGVYAVLSAWPHTYPLGMWIELISSQDLEPMTQKGLLGALARYSDRTGQLEAFVEASFEQMFQRHTFPINLEFDLQAWVGELSINKAALRSRSPWAYGMKHLGITSVAFWMRVAGVLKGKTPWEAHLAATIQTLASTNENKQAVVCRFIQNGAHLTPPENEARTLLRSLMASSSLPETSAVSWYFNTPQFAWRDLVSCVQKQFFDQSFEAWLDRVGGKGSPLGRAYRQYKWISSLTFQAQEQALFSFWAVLPKRVDLDDLCQHLTRRPLDPKLVRLLGYWLQKPDTSQDNTWNIKVAVLGLSFAPLANSKNQLGFEDLFAQVQGLDIDHFVQAMSSLHLTAHEQTAGLEFLSVILVDAEAENLIKGLLQRGSVKEPEVLQASLSNSQAYVRERQIAKATKPSWSPALFEIYTTTNIQRRASMCWDKGECIRPSGGLTTVQTYGSVTTLFEDGL